MLKIGDEVEIKTPKRTYVGVYTLYNKGWYYVSHTRNKRRLTYKVKRANIKPITEIERN